MKCLYCGKEIKTSAKSSEIVNRWHARCTKKFFGTSVHPEIVLDRTQLEDLAVKTVHKGLTVPGVQKKLSLHLEKEGKETRLTIVNYPTGYIMKPQSEDFGDLPEYEYTAMKMAEIAGIRTVPNALILVGDELAYITKRIDRVIDGEKVECYAMEDFCQLAERSTRDKYRGSCEICAKLISRYSQREKLDLSELFVRVVFSFMIGNSDMHLKNFSLIEDEPGSRVFHLSDAYDILPVNLVMPEDTEELALPMNGKKQNLRRNDFLVFAERCGLEKKTAVKLIDRICSFEEKYHHVIRESFLNEEEKERFSAFVSMRIERLLQSKNRNA